MGRLIDADALLNELLTENQKCITSTGHELTMNMIVSFINHQPIVFDKEKVIAELEQKKGTYFDGLPCEGMKIRINDAIDIVRKGGVE